MNKIVSIVGPTASGKSSLGIFLAKKFSGQIISVDSRQVYRGMDLGTGKVEGSINRKSCINIKIQKKQQITCPFISEDINHWMIDVADPKKDVVSVAEFQIIAYQIIFHLLHKKQLPILVGGTMLYLDAIMQGYRFPKTSLKLRQELENYSTQKLLLELKENDPESYKKIDRNNRRRIIRAMESYLVNRSSHLSYKKKKPNFQSLIIGIDWDRKELYERIDKRVDERIKQGMIEEVKTLHDRGVSWEKLMSFGLEYRLVSEYLQGQIARKSMIEKLKYKIHGYARRQLSWWRRNKNIKWLKADKNLTQNAEKLVNDYLQK